MKLPDVIKKINAIPIETSTSTSVYLPDRIYQVENAVDLDNLDNYLYQYKSYDFWEGSLDDVKEYTKIIKKAVITVRSSVEYRRYIKYLREEVNISKCSLLQGVDHENSSIEIHHYPFTLYDITDIVAQYFIKNELEFSTISLAERVCQLHFQNKVGLVPLSKTAHELAHSGSIFVSLKNIFGNVRSFMSEYSLGMNSEYIDRLNALIKLETSAVAKDANQVMFTKKRLAWVIGSQTFNSLDNLEDTTMNTDGLTETSEDIMPAESLTDLTINVPNFSESLHSDVFIKELEANYDIDFNNLE
jgi:hypothetical protein